MTETKITPKWESGKEPAARKKAKAHAPEEAAANLSHNRATKQGPRAAPSTPALRLSPQLARSFAADSDGSLCSVMGTGLHPRPHSAGGSSTSQHQSTDFESSLTRPTELGPFTEGGHGQPSAFCQVSVTTW